MERDDLDAMWAQAELEERQQREEAAMARCRPLLDELKRMIEQTKGDDNGDYREICW